MKIVRAMKEISRIKGEIKDLKNRMERCLNALDGNDYTEDFQELWDKYNERTTKLIQLKNAVMESNVKTGTFNLVLKLGELKSYMDFLKELKVKDGLNIERYGDTVNKFHSQISEKSKRKTIEFVQKEINALTDKLDDINATTDIGDVDVSVQPMPRIDGESSD